MKEENRKYEVTPRILRSDQECEIVIRPLQDSCRFEAGGQYTIHHYFMEGSPLSAHSELAGTWSVTPDSNGVLKFRSRFLGEQEHLVRVAPAQGRPPLEFRLFSVQADLFGRRPFKVDFHTHSNRSDGKENPEYVAAACRKIGMDAMAVTDHYRYAPSLEAIQAFAGIEHDLRIFPGEEVHPPDVPVHMINFGGRFSINDLFKSDQYRHEVEAIQAEIAATCSPAVDPYQAAACVWSCTKIKEAGGLAIYSHPHWVNGPKYDVPGALTKWLFEHQPFEAFEVIGGYGRAEAESNQLQAAWHNDLRAKGKDFPVVGASDIHGVESGTVFGWYYSIVFSPSPSLEDLLASVRHRYSVAVEALPGEGVRPYSSYRLVKYAFFVCREILPLHDALCAQEGRLMLEYLAGNSKAVAELTRLKGQCERLYNRLWQAEP